MVNKAIKSLAVLINICSQFEIKENFINKIAGNK